MKTKKTIIIGIGMMLLMISMASATNYYFSNSGSDSSGGLNITNINFTQNTLLICTNLHWVALAAFVIGSITLYAKKPTSETEGFIR